MVKRLGLPDPPRLRRHHSGARELAGAVLLGGEGRLTEPIASILAEFDADIRRPNVTAPGSVEADPDATAEPALAGRFGASIFDATAITSSDRLVELFEFFQPYARSLVECGRVLVLGTPPELATSGQEAIAQRALEGFTRSVGKEFGHGITAQLVYVAPGAESRLESTLRFLLSGKSAYVSGQVIRVGAAGKPTTDATLWNWDRPLVGKIALVTGAARGIGASIAEVLSRDGATVVCLDVPSSGDALGQVANEVGGTALQLDLTATDAPDRLVDFLRERYGRIDVVVHNAGITRDKTLANMSEDMWSSVLAVNLSAPQRVNDALLAADLIPAGGRIVGVSSVAGIAGNRGQTNYATSKAGVIGMVLASAPTMASRGVTVNAVAPGFIETAMTARMPVVVREAGRRMNSLAQGGQPIDVAETVAWLASPGSEGVTGNVVRVCGQSLLGA
jgi:3-oxoacyl-[acyl-carrier protein] reductase